MKIRATVTDRPVKWLGNCWLNFPAPGLEEREHVPILLWLGLKDRVSSEQVNVSINLRRQSKHTVESLAKRSSFTMEMI